MTQDHNEEAEGSRLPDTDKLRRFSLGIGVALLIYVFAGGHIGETLQTVLIPIVKFDRPQFLLGALVLASIYSTSRYWYYGIHLSLTRRKIREYLRKIGSVFVFVGDEKYFEEQATSSAAPQTETRQCLAELYSKVPLGLPRTDFQVITHKVREENLVKEQVSKKLNKYFPGLQAENISVGRPQKSLGWAHVATTSQSTNWWCWLEDFELWLPITVNGVALLALLTRETWPLIIKLV